MARFGSNLIAGLINPSFGGNLTALGEQIGSAQAVGRKRRMLSDLMTPLMSSDASETDYSNAAMRLAEMGDLDRATQVSQLGRNVGARRRALRDQMTQDQLAMNEQASLRRLKANAISTLQKRADLEADPVKKQKILDGLTIARTSNQRDVLEGLISGRTVGSANLSFIDGGKYRTKPDANGNTYEYLLTIKRDKETGEVENVYTPVQKGAPAYTGGELEFLGGAYGETGVEASGRQVEAAATKQKKLNFLDFRSEELQEYGPLRERILTGNALLEALSEINTGGVINTSFNSISKLLGTQNVNAGNFEFLAKELMLQDLKKFGSNPTEGEREAAAELVASIKNREELNEAIITRFLEIQQRRLLGIQFLSDNPNATEEEYVAFMNQFYDLEPLGGTNDDVDYTYTYGSGIKEGNGGNGSSDDAPRGSNRRRFTGAATPRQSSVFEQRSGVGGQMSRGTGQ
jgi:hypothetical protein